MFIWPSVLELLQIRSCNSAPVGFMKHILRAWMPCLLPNQMFHLTEILNIHSCWC